MTHDWNEVAGSDQCVLCWLTQAHTKLFNTAFKKVTTAIKAKQKVKQISRTAAKSEVLSLKRAGADHSSDAMQEVFIVELDLCSNTQLVRK